MRAGPGGDGALVRGGRVLPHEQREKNINGRPPLSSNRAKGVKLRQADAASPPSIRTPQVLLPITPSHKEMTRVWATHAPAGSPEGQLCGVQAVCVARRPIHLTSLRLDLDPTPTPLFATIPGSPSPLHPQHILFLGGGPLQFPHQLSCPSAVQAGVGAGRGSGIECVLRRSTR